MSLLDKLTIKNLKLNKKRTIVTIIGIMLSAALITAVASIYSSGINSLINYEKYQKGDFHCLYADVSEEEISKFENNRKIENVYLTKGVGYAKINSKNENKPYAFIKSFTEDSLKHLSVKLIDGRLPKNENEILIPTHLESNGRLKLNVGDLITLDVGKRVTNDGSELNQNNPYNADDEQIIVSTTKTYKIVGVIERPASNIENYEAPGYTFVTYTHDNVSGNADLYVKYTKDGIKDAYKITADILNVDKNLFEQYYKGKINSEKQMEKFINEMENAKYQINFNHYLIGLETDPIKSSSVAGLGMVVIIICLIIVITSVFCIKNSFDISITEKTKQYGILRSVGATKRQIKKNVFYEATILGIIGIPLGIILGVLATYILIITSNYFIKDLMEEGLQLTFSFSIVSIIVAVLLGIITIYFSAFRSARKASKVSPIDSIRNSSSIKINPKKLKSPKFIKKIFGMGGEISYKNLKRNKKKYRTTVISIVISVFIFIALSSFMNMAFDTVKNELKISEHNFFIAAHDYNENTYNKYLETTKLDSIENYSVIRQNVLEVKNAKYNKKYLEWIKHNQKGNDDTNNSVVAVGKEQYDKYIKSLGLKYDEIKDKAILYDNIIVSSYDKKQKKQISKYIRTYDYKIGDVITGNFVDDDKSYNFEVGAISKKKPFGLKNIEGKLLIVSDELFDKLTTSSELGIYYKSSDVTKLQNEIDEILKGEDYYLDNVEENVKSMNNLSTLIGIFLYGFVIVISLIGITNIFNTITTNMELRKQEFAMLKSVGMTTKEFKRMIRLESLFMGVKSLFYGIPIGIVLSYLIYHYLVQDSGLPFELPIVAIMIAVIAVFLLITSLMRYSINKINKQNIIETIRNENI